MKSKMELRDYLRMPRWKQEGFNDERDYDNYINYRATQNRILDELKHMNYILEQFMNDASLIR